MSTFLTDKTILLAAGQAMLATSRGAGVLYVGMPLAWLAGLIFSVIMLRSRALRKAAAWAGIIGFGLLVVGIPFGGHYTAAETPTVLQGVMVAVQYIAGGMLSMAWYLLVGLGLLKIGLQSDTTP